MKPFFRLISVWSCAVAMLCVISTVFAVPACAQRRAADKKSKYKPSYGQLMIVDIASDFALGDYSNCYVLAQELIRLEPKNDVAHYYSGMCLMMAGKTDEGIEGLKKAVSLDPHNYHYREKLALSYSVSQKTELAINAYEELLKDYPDKTDNLYALVQLYISDNRLDEALKTLGEVETQKGKSDASVMTTFNILNHQGKQDEAVAVLKSYVEEYSSPVVLAMLGDFEISAYRDSAAIGYYDEALLIDKDFVPALIGKAEVCRITRKYSDYFENLDKVVANKDVPSEDKCKYIGAVLGRSDRRFITSFRQNWDNTINLACEVHPKDSSVIRTAAMYYFSTEREDKGLDMCRQNAELYPDEPSMAYTYVQALASIQKWPEAGKVADEAISKFSGNAAVMQAFVELSNYAAYNVKDYRKIISNAGKILAITPLEKEVSLSAYSSMGDAYHELGESVKAYSAYRQALKIDPKFSPVLNNYAYYLSVEGKSLKKACAMSKKTVDAEPDNATYLDTYGWILHLMGKDAEAKTVFKQAMLYGGKESAVILGHYATVLEKLGETDLAKVYRGYEATKAAEGKE